MEYNKFTRLYVTYSCSKCGNTVVTSHIVRETTNVSNDEKIVWQDSVSQTRKNDEEAEVSRKVKRIFKEEEKGRYRLAEFDCRCSNCNHREPWSKMRYYIFDVIFGSILPFAILLTIFVFIVGVCLLGIVALYLFIKVIHRIITEKRINNLPVMSLPCVSLKQQESIELFNMKKKNLLLNKESEE